MKIIYRLRSFTPCYRHETVGILGARESDMGKTVAYNFFLPAQQQPEMEKRVMFGENNNNNLGLQ